MSVNLIPRASAHVGGDREPGLRAGSAIDARDESVAVERRKRHQVAIGVHDERSGDDDRRAATFCDLSSGRSEKRAADAATAVCGEADEAGVQTRGAAFDAGPGAEVDLDVDARLVGVGTDGSCRVEADALDDEVRHGHRRGVDRRAERAASARPVGRAPAAKCEPSSGTRMVQ